MKAGASYVAIDPTYPKSRIEFMLRDSGAPVLITHHRLRMRLPEHEGKTVFIDRDRHSILAESCRSPRLSMDCRDAAYMIYTSGSTGTPKGVLGTHRASMNRFAWMWARYPFDAEEICAQRTSLSFVDSVCEIFGPLLQGVPIVVIPHDAAMVAMSMSNFIMYQSAMSYRALRGPRDVRQRLWNAGSDIGNPRLIFGLCATSVFA